MNRVTFEENVQCNLRKESIEWLRIWCEDTNNEKLPRVALVGDSITEGYFPIVKETLQEIAKVDLLVTSYSIASKVYRDTVKNFINDSNYAVVHFNYGLHAGSVSDALYAEYCQELLQFISARAKTIVTTTTTVLDRDDVLKSENPIWKRIVAGRNAKILQIANECNLHTNDLNSLCKTFDITKRLEDGWHFTEAGYQELANSVVSAIKKSYSIGESIWAL